MSSGQSESDSFANLSSSSDEDIMEPGRRGRCWKNSRPNNAYQDKPLAYSEATAGTEENEEADLDDLTSVVLEARYEG